jgi:hypothetical protein
MGQLWFCRIWPKSGSSGLCVSARHNSTCSCYSQFTSKASVLASITLLSASVRTNSPDANASQTLFISSIFLIRPQNSACGLHGCCTVTDAVGIGVRGGGMGTLHTCNHCPWPALDSFFIQLLQTSWQGCLQLLVSILDILLFIFLSDLAWLLFLTCAPPPHALYNLSFFLFSSLLPPFCTSTITVYYPFASI